MWPSTRTPAEEEPEDASIEQADVDVIATLPLRIQRIPGAALLEVAPCHAIRANLQHPANCRSSDRYLTHSAQAK